MASYQEIETPIEGLKILLNKVVGDERGYFCDLAETDNPIFADGVKHLHASIATQKGIERGGHYHYRLKENFYTLGGTALWIYHDFREDSPSFGRTHALILGLRKARLETSLPIYTIEENRMAQIIIPPKIYHAFVPLTEEPAVVFVTGTEGYDENDFARPKLEEIPEAKEILEAHGIK